MLLSNIFGWWFHSYGGIIPYFAKYIATVHLLISLSIELCYHYFGIYVIPFYANNIATVYLLLFVNVESCSLYFGGIIPFIAYIIAYVFPFLSLSSGY